MDLEIRRGRAQFIPKQKEICLILKGIQCPPACRGVVCGGSMAASQRTCGRRGWEGEAGALVVGGQPPDVKEKTNYNNNNNKRNRRRHKGENRYEK